jgi:hypothetical protein
MRHYLKVPQIAAVMGMCVAAERICRPSDVILMVEGTSFMGLAVRISSKARPADDRQRNARRRDDAQCDLGRRTLSNKGR